MNEYIKAMEARLTDDQKDMLAHIYEPQSVAVPLSDSRRDVCIMPDGEIRAYGLLYGNEHVDIKTKSQKAYLSSTDCGISWTLHYSHGNMGSCTYIPEKSFYITCISHSAGENTGTYILISDKGPEDEQPKKIKISDYCYFDTFLPQKSEYSDRIWVSGQRLGDDRFCVPAFIYSDDFGESWNIIELPLTPKHEVIYPHKGLRWSITSGCEPHVAELSKDKMMMILRTSTDYFYQSISYDGGSTWSEMTPTVFHGTNTTAYLLKLSDGKTLALWNNTQPLPELRHEKQLPPLDSSTIDGVWEDVFTNRDANHAAITEDGGETWIGFRELWLNEVRNNSDFRYVGNKYSSNDKSVHQFQAFELPYGKILVSMGQNDSSRRLVIFDIRWLYETSRSENFLKGLKNVTTHVYLKSISGSTAHLSSGHCAWNRTSGAVMMPDPDGGYLDNVLISKRRDDRLYNDIQGVVWNFPASKKGTVSAEIKLIEKRVRISLADHWFNACDEFAGALSQFTFELDLNDIDSSFVKIDIEYDTDDGISEVYADGKFLFKVRMTCPAPTGISYIIVQCATDGDSKGVYLRKLEKRDN